MSITNSTNLHENLANVTDWLSNGIGGTGNGHGSLGWIRQHFAGDLDWSTSSLWRQNSLFLFSWWFFRKNEKKSEKNVHFGDKWSVKFNSSDFHYNIVFFVKLKIWNFCRNDVLTYEPNSRGNGWFFSMFLRIFDFKFKFSWKDRTAYILVVGFS